MALVQNGEIQQTYENDTRNITFGGNVLLPCNCANNIYGARPAEHHNRI